MLQVLFFAALWSGLASAQAAVSGARTIPLEATLKGKEIAGFAASAGKVFVWGDNAFEIDLRSGKARQIAQGHFAEGGCLLDNGLILNSLAPRELLWLRLSDDRLFVVDTGVDTRDAVAADLLGHHGLLLIHKRQQVRFYDLPSPMKDGWAESELYTIYTPSTEGGLVVADVDGDGLPDLLCGNYWMKSPARFELPWREFAIDLWTEEEKSAMLKLAWNPGKHIRVAGQREMRPGRVAWFERPSDPKQLWAAHDIGTHGAAGAIFINEDLIILERDFPGRLLRFEHKGPGFADGRELIRTNQAVGMTPLTTGGLLIVEKSRLVLLPPENFN